MSVACPCGCGQPVTSSRATYASEACRSRVWRRNSGYAVQTAAQASQTRRRRAAAARRAPAPARVDFERAVEAVALIVGEDAALAALEPLLTDKGRAALAARKGGTDG